MPPKRRIPASRISKNKANATLRRIIAPTVRQRDLIDPPVLPIDPNHIQNPNSAPRIPGQAEEIPRIDIALLNTLITRLEGYETGLDAVKTTIQDNQIEARQANLDIFNQLMERLDNLGTAPAERPRIDSQVPDVLSGTSSSLVAVNVLARWSWIDLPTAESIANGTFDINSLPKLHRDQSLRNRHVTKTFESFVIPLDGSKPELVSGSTKMQSSFRDLSTFLSAWLIYISVRTSYSPDRGPGLASWTERLVFLSQCGYQWSTILDYAIAYYGDHQNSPLETWFKVDGELIANHFGISQQRSSNHPSAKPVAFSASSVGPSKTVQASSTIPKHLQICLNYNRDRCTNPCANGRRHVCAICVKDHAASHCPLAKQSAS